MANGEGWILAANERLRISLGYSYQELLKMKLEELCSTLTGNYLKTP